MHRRKRESPLGGTDWMNRLRAHQSAFSMVTGVIAMLLVCVLLSDLIVKHPGFDFWPVVGWLSIFSVVAVVAFVWGKHLPRWAGLVFVGISATWSTFGLLYVGHLHAALNALLELPVTMLYVGWFFPVPLARVLMAMSAVRVGLTVVINPELGAPYTSKNVLVGYAILIAIFCFEGALAVRKQGELEVMRDPLTGAYNRRGLVQLQQKLRTRAEQASTEVSVAILDLDHFKKLNDIGGHAAGDAALRATAAAWMELATHSRIPGQKGGMLARHGGDEFVLLWARPAAETEAELTRLRETAVFEWSWGVATVLPEEDFSAALARADARLYLAKRSRQH